MYIPILTYLTFKEYTNCVCRLPKVVVPFRFIFHFASEPTALTNLPYHHIGV